MRRFLGGGKKPAEQAKTHVTRWFATLTKLKDALSGKVQREYERTLVARSDLGATLDALKSVLLSEEDRRAGDIGDCLEYCFEEKFFSRIVSEACTDRPKGVFSVVVRFLTALVNGIKKQVLLPHRAFHGPVTGFLLWVSEHMKKGAEFDSVEMVNFLHAISCVVHRNPTYVTVFYHIDGEILEYMPLPILLTFFREESQCEQPKLRESLLLCTQLEDKEAVAHILKGTNIIQILVMKLGSYFQSLPQVWRHGENEDSQAIEELHKYASFLDSLCERCLWKELLSEVGSIFQTFFCDEILSPRLQHRDSLVRSTCSWYLSGLIHYLSTPVLLMPLTYYFKGKKPRDCMYLPTPRGRKSMPFEDETGPITPRTELRLTSWSTLLENLDSGNELLRLRTLQILYLLVEKRQWRVLKTLFVEGFRPPPNEKPVNIKEFFNMYRGWMSEEAMNESYLQCHSYIFTSVLSRSETNPRGAHRVSTGETESSDKIWEDTGGIYPISYGERGELLTILIRKMKQLLVNSFDENVLITGIFALILAFPGRQIRSLQFFLLSNLTGSLGAVLQQLNEKIRAQVSDLENFPEALRVAKEVHGRTPRENPLHGVLRRKQKTQNRREDDQRLIDAVVVFEEFINEVAGTLLMQDQMSTLRDEAELQSANLYRD